MHSMVVLGFTGSLTIPGISVDLRNWRHGAFNGCTGFTGLSTIPKLQLLQLVVCIPRLVTGFTGTLTIP